MQIVWHIVIVFFLLLLIMPIFSKAYGYFDVLGNIGVVSLYVFFIKIFAYKIKILKGSIVFYTEKNRKEIEVQVSKKQLRFLKQFTVQMKQKIIIKNVTAFSRIGLNDAYSTALCVGTFNTLCSSVMGYIKNLKPSAKMRVVNHPEYNSSRLTFAAQITGFITLIDVLYALFMSFVIIKRSEKYERV